MNKLYSRLSFLVAVIFGTSLSFAPALADTINVDFENPLYTTGSINGQNGWSSTGPYDQGVIITPAGFPAFGSQSFRISDSVVSGSFGDQTFSKSLLDEAGETDALNNGFSGGSRQPHFEAQFDLASTMADIQPGMHLSVSPDRGDGARMSYLRFEDAVNGINVFFDDVQGTSAPVNFVETQIATDLSRTSVHAIKFVMDFVDGPSNDVVKIYIDGNLVHTGTSWENYYRFDPESNPSLVSNSRTVDALLFRESGTSNVGNTGKGFLIDNLSLLSGPTPVIVPELLTCPAGTTKTFIETKSVDSTLISPTQNSNPLTSGGTYLLVASGAWENRNATNQKADAEYDTMNSWTTFMNGYDMGDYQLGEGEFDLQVDNAFINWGSYNPNHEYSYLYTGTGSPVSFGVFDGNSNSGPGAKDAGWYGDNSGNLTVDIYSCTIPPTNSNVHIFKYINGVQAISENANGASFPMFTATYNAPFVLGPNGWTTGDIAYEASTGPMPLGASYSAEENLNTNLVASTCDGIHPYALIGYSVGNTLSEAQSTETSLTIPSFTNIQGEKYIIVKNKTCEVLPPIKVHIAKYLNGSPATSQSTGNTIFPMTASWSALNIGSGSGNYTLGTGWGGATGYSADTAPMSVPADYTTNEITDGSLVVSSRELCAPGKYLLNGYRVSSVSFEDAALQTISIIAPAFTSLTSDRFVIVDNSKCPETGSISGMKYNDLNRNGKKDPREPGLQGWVIKLIIDSDENDREDNEDVVVATTTTDADGNYTFSNVAPGIYEVRETHQKGWKRMSKNPKDIVIVPGSEINGVNFGNAVKLKKEKEDDDRDDNRHEQNGKYYGHREKSDYEKEQGNKDHSRERVGEKENRND